MAGMISDPLRITASIIVVRAAMKDGGARPSSGLECGNRLG